MVAWERYRAWVTTANVTEADLTKEVVDDLVEQASSTPPDPDHPVELTPTGHQIEAARTRKQWTRAVGSGLAAFVVVGSIAQLAVDAPLLLAAAILGTAGWLWHLGRDEPK